MSSSSNGQVHPQPAGRLNGWKEISAYLNKSVRTVQRWEKDLRLPVHRIHGNGGEIIFAQVEEIEAWLHGAREQIGEARESEASGHAIAATASPLPPPVLALHKNAWRWIAMASLVALALVVTVWSLTQWSARQPRIVQGKISDWKVERGDFVALNREGHALWRFAADPPLPDASYKDQGVRPRQVVIADFNGNGIEEVAIVDPTADVLRILEAGKELRHFQPDMEVDFGGAPHHTWALRGVSLVRNPGAAPDLWLRIHHSPWFPSALLRLDPRTAKVLSIYWSSGHITFEKEAIVDGRRVMFVGATNNDSKGASLAVLDYDHANGVSPALNSEFACTRNCPSGGLLRFYLFPQMELSRATETRPYVAFVRLDGSGNPLIDVQQTLAPIPGRGEKVEGTAFYSMTRDFRVARAETGDAYRQAHYLLEAAGVIKHPFGLACEKELFPVMRWDGRKFLAETGTLASPPRNAKPVVAGKSDRARLSPTALRR